MADANIATQKMIGRGKFIVRPREGNDTSSSQQDGHWPTSGASADASVSAPNRFRHNEMSSLELRIGSPPAINSYASNHSSPVFAGRQQTHIRVNRLATPR